jgi:NAD+ synthase
MSEIKNLDKIMRVIRLPKIKPAKVSEEIENFIVENITGAGKTGGVIGLSGGIDSTTVAYLAKRGFDRYNSSNPDADQLNLYGMILPSKANHPEDTRNGIRVAEALGVEYSVVEISPLVESYRTAMPGRIERDFDIGNLSSETRAIALSREAAYQNSLVLGTGNKDEDYGLGYFSKRGDGAIDINPIGNLSKRNVRTVASHIGVPEDIIGKIPTAGLCAGQTDEKDLGFSYLESEIVIGGKDQGYNRDQLKKITGFGKVRCDEDKNIVDKVLDMHYGNQFKMKMPPVANISVYWSGGELL